MSKKEAAVAAKPAKTPVLTQPIRKLRERATLAGFKNWEDHTSADVLSSKVNDLTDEGVEKYTHNQNPNWAIDLSTAYLTYGDVLCLSIDAGGKFKLYGTPSLIDFEQFLDAVKDFLKEADKSFDSAYTETHEKWEALQESYLRRDQMTSAPADD